MKEYPNVAEIFEQKARLRRHLASLPFEEKIEILLRMQERRRSVKAAVPVFERELDRPVRVDMEMRRDIDK
ncbi:MAG: hypothetical protein ABIP75_18395 [Pyrinomonadaceae bacterium]